MTGVQKNLKDEAEEQILQVTIPGSGVITKSGKEKEKEEESESPD
ncbi:hypothetical protein ACFQH6_20520 [Halobacteriaceae archaeon GCM10025711]